MKINISLELPLLFRLMCYLVTLAIVAHIFFIFLALFNLKIPQIANVDYVYYPKEVFISSNESKYPSKCLDDNYAHLMVSSGFALKNINNSSDTLRITAVGASIAVDVANNKNILLGVFIRRITFLTILLIVCYQLDKLLSSLKNDKPFNAKNIRRMKIIAYTIISVSPIGLLLNEMMILSFNKYYLSNSMMISHNLNLHYVLIGLILLVFAKVFKVGTDLQNDYDHTI
ncbi:MAG: DUF2975 domain-containing protein [Bacteroidales bacterium]|nr:MAG: DUF2975 domain-containing protein [Bacteroidales bacterium]